MFLKIMLKNLKNREGFTLIETLIAISVFSLSIISLLSVLGGGISNTNYAQAKMVASYLAQEGVESIRNMRDSHMLFGGGLNWTTFKSELSACTSSGSPCGFNSALPVRDTDFVFSCGDCRLYLQNGGYSTGGAGTPSSFTRHIWRELLPSPDEIIIYSKVSFTEGSGSYSVTLKGNLFNWAE